MVEFSGKPYSWFPHMVEDRGREAASSLLFLIIRALIPFMRAPPSWPDYLPKASPPNAITLGIRASTRGMRESQTVYSNCFFF